MDAAPPLPFWPWERNDPHLNILVRQRILDDALICYKKVHYLSVKFWGHGFGAWLPFGHHKDSALPRYFPGVSAATHPLTDVICFVT